MYFKSFPKFIYDFSINNNDEDLKYVTDIFHRVKITAEMVEQSSAYEKYIIKDGETIEIISHKIYGTPLYHWTILLANNITNPYIDLPMSNYAFEQYIIQKYGSTRDDIKHYKNNDGYIITPISIIGIGTNCIYNPVTSLWESINLADYSSVTNYDYEFALNETKRVINVIRPQFISGVVEKFKQMMKA